MSEPVASTESSVLQLMRFLPHQPVRGMPVESGHLDIEVPLNAAAASDNLEVDFALALARLIDDACNDPSQLRTIVYQFARERLHDQIPTDDPAQSQKATRALDVAIERVEAFAQAQGNRQSGTPAQLHPLQSVIEQLAVNTPAGPPQALPAFMQRPARSAAPRRSRLAFAAGRKGSTLIRFLAVLAVVLGTLATISFFQARREGPIRHDMPKASMGGWANAPDRGSEAAGSGAPEVHRAAMRPEATSARAGPAPAGAGIYAVSSNRLFKLDALPLRVPESRNAFAAKMRMQPTQRLPSGKLKFIVNRAPGETSIATAEVRPVARIARETTIDGSGRPMTTFPDDSWMVRSLTHSFRAQPARDADSMYELLSDDPALTLSPGRYALIVDRVAYDFTIDGAVKSREHCLERLTLDTGVLHSECGQALFVQ